MRNTDQRAKTYIIAFFSLLLVLAAAQAVEPVVIGQKLLATNLIAEMLLEELPPREVSAMNLSPKERESLKKMELNGKLVRPQSLNRYRLFVSEPLNGRRVEVWSRSFDKYDHGPHFPPALVFHDAVLVRSNLYVCYKTYGRLCVELLEHSPQLAWHAVDSSAPTIIFKDVAAAGWLANSASFILTNHSQLSLEVKFNYERSGRWVCELHGGWVEQPIKTEVKPGVIVTRTAGIDVNIVEVHRQTNAPASALVRCKVFPAACDVTANGVSASESTGHFRVLNCPLRSENNFEVHVVARLEAKK